MRRNCQVSFCLLFFALLVGGFWANASAQAKPDFTGSWVVNAEKSKLEVKFRLDSAVFTIGHKEPRFRLSRVFVIDGKKDALAWELTTDGREAVTEEDGRTVRSRLYWDGDALVFDVRYVLKDGREATNVVRYTLQDGGKTFVAEEKFRGPVLKYDNLWVADRGEPLRGTAAVKRIPTVEDLMALKSVGSPRISPDGSRVAFTVTETDFEQDAYVTQIWLADSDSGNAIQLTRGKKSSSGPTWSPDGRWIAFTSSRADDKSQIFVISPDGGEAVQLTKAETGVAGFDWSPDGKTIAFTASDPVSEEAKARKDFYDDYDVVRREYTHTHLWTVDVSEGLRSPQPGQRRTSGRSFTVGGFDWSPDGSKIAFSGSINPDLINGGTSDIYVLDLAGNTVKKIVSQPGPDSSPRWSPDGRSVLFSSALGRRDYFAANSVLALVPADGGSIRPLSAAFDENAGAVEWNDAGIYFSAMQRTAAHLFRLDPVSFRIERLSAPDEAMVSGFTFSRDGKRAAFQAATATALPEICVSEFPWNPRVLTRMTDQVGAFTLGTRELISWKSKDGATIEGVLIKPADFDPARKYALLCVIHGGPTGVDRPALLSGDSRYYPSDIWAARGALILKVNYRGSAGYGAKFRILNYRNLGVGDAWDVLSGVDYLVKKGWVDPARVGCMGWSQGGYISAFLTTSTKAFKAISVGAGISNWATYYYNTDITPFTINYLGADPAADPAIYAKTSPMTYIGKASTPTLIQHGEFDKRVPIPNGYELRQGLEDRGVPVEMVVYKGYGHGITKPKSMRAVMEHNLAWFGHYIFGDPKPELAAPPVPPKSDAKDKKEGER